MRIVLLAGAVLALLPVAAFAQIQAQDLAFIAQTRHSIVTNLLEAQMVQTHASSGAVKDYAHHIIQDQVLQDQELAAMLKAAGLPLMPLSTAPDEVQQQADLRALYGPLFDHVYLAAQVRNHQHMEQVLQGEIQAGNDANLKAFAQRSLPIVQSHLALAQRLLGAAG